MNTALSQDTSIAADTEPVPCPACGKEQPVPLLTARDRRGASRERFAVVRCRACGHLYTSPRPTEQAIGRYYPSAYYDDNGRGSRGRGGSAGSSSVTFRERCIRAALRHHWGYPQRTGGGGLWHRAVMRCVTRPVSWWIARARRRLDALPWAGQGRLLDFGCGGGSFLRLQRDRGWTVAGMDFNEAVAAELRSDDALDVRAGTWPGPVMADRTFDAITAWHVIEHLPDPVGWVRQAASQLAPGGYLLIVCPNADSWAARRFGADWIGYDVPRHFSHFTPGVIQRLVTDAGLEVVRQRGEARPSALRRSAAAMAEQTSNPVQRWLWKRKSPWKLAALATRILDRADGMWVLARKPAAR